MTWTALQGLEVVSFLLLAGCAHLALRRSRRSLIAGLREIAGDLVRDLARVSDVVASLIYVAFAFTSVPMGYFQPTGEEIEAVLGHDRTLRSGCGCCRGHRPPVAEPRCPSPRSVAARLPREGGGMRLPTVAGVIDRRLLVNFTLDPEVASQLVPDPFRPQLLHGRAVAGICLIRLTNVRPAGAPASLGVSSENAAHRIAVTWDNEGYERNGVFIPRRDTSSRINALLGGRIFPGMQHHADFNVQETPPDYKVGFESDDGSASVSVAGRVTERLPENSIFSSVSEASAFFENGAAGYSATQYAGRFDGLALGHAYMACRPA